MRFYIINLSCLVCFATSAKCMRVTEDSSVAAVWFSELDDFLVDMDGHEVGFEKVDKLGSLLRKLGRQPDHPDKRWRDLYKRTQQKMLAIPGHAQYLADEIERIRKSAEGTPRGTQVSYDRARWWYIGETLPHLPSPETVKVLGDYLDDMRDEELHESGAVAGETAYIASSALSRIGLRSSPVEPMSNWMRLVDENGIDLREEPLQKMRDWYDEVRRGERSFSFVNQDVAYRFRPDGTWASEPIINNKSKTRSDASLRFPSSPRHSPDAGLSEQGSAPSTKLSRGQWIGGTAAVLLLLASILKLLRRNKC